MSDFDLKRQIAEVIDEILSYKWLESEKEGTDIGLRRATREWIDKYYDTWFEYNNERFYKESNTK